MKGNGTEGTVASNGEGHAGVEGGPSLSAQGSGTARCPGQPVNPASGPNDPEPTVPSLPRDLGAVGVATALSIHELEARAAGAVEEAERRARAARNHGEFIEAWLWRLRCGLRGGAFAGERVGEVLAELGDDAGALALLEQAAGDEDLDPLDREMLVRVVNHPYARDRGGAVRGAAFAAEDAALRAKQAEREKAKASA